ncbi:MAG: quinone-dependent dihydroorotate dehydrogenase [Solirubrobacterales bacterium]|nr:quinone-dependent dihydroorotate dehydrogenase [Solirubrobacterales bacterium]
MIYRLFFSVLVLARIDGEAAHSLAVLALRAANALPGVPRLLDRALVPRDPALQVRALGMTFPSPLGLAAGADSSARWFEAAGHLGFGFVEVGTVTAARQRGNPRPRVFRLARDHAILNRRGFPNDGARAVAERLARRRGASPIVGVNVGKGMTVPVDEAGRDYRASIQALAPLADYVVLNVSSPNTPGLRQMQSVERLAALIADARGELRAAGSRTPLLIKVAPDLSDEELDAIADLAVSTGVDGIVAVNTTTSRAGLSDPSAIPAGVGDGGVSGAPLGPRALEVLRRLRARAGEEVTLISVGGVQSAEDVWERVLAGASLVQAYTGFVYGGPLWPSRANRALARRVHQAGASSIQELVGAGSPVGGAPA